MGIKNGCNNPDCKVSTGICEGLTFGSGELDDNGYWQIPCGKCARAWEKHHPEDGACWPYKPEDLTEAGVPNAKQSV